MALKLKVGVFFSLVLSYVLFGQTSLDRIAVLNLDAVSISETESINPIKIKFNGSFEKSINNKLVKQSIACDDSVKKKTKINAMWRSILLPGWGQAYQEKTVQTLLYPILVAGGLVGSYLMINNYNKAVDEYNVARDLYLNAFSEEDISTTRAVMDKAYDDVESKESTRNILFIATGAIWLWNVMDTIILPPGYKSNVNLSAESDKNKVLARMSLNF